MFHLFSFSSKMLYVIITARSLLWMLTSLISALLMLSALVSPAWLVAPIQTYAHDNKTLHFNPSVGVYARCNRPSLYNREICTSLAVRGLATDSEVFPDAWKAAVVFIALGMAVMCATVFSSLLSCCFQSLCRKSVFTVSGAAQAVAGELQ